MMRREGSDHEDERPSVLPRTSALDVLNSAVHDTTGTARPKLVSEATTAITSTLVQSRTTSENPLAFHLKSKVSAASLSATVSQSSAEDRSVSTKQKAGVSDDDSVHGVPAKDNAPDVESLMGELLPENGRMSFWDEGSDSKPVIHNDMQPDDGLDLTDLQHEFDLVDPTEDGELSEQELLNQWRSKQKQFLILSQSGKPIWQRHGSDKLVSSYLGAIQTIISFFESSGDSLRSFVAGTTRVVVLSQTPLYLIGTSKLGESETQLRNQLDALYMQILSTLTFPNISQIFSLHPTADLRRPLRGTENLLSALADSFTYGSPSTLLSSLECLRLRKRERKAINDVFLRNRCKELLYGLIVAGGRLVSVIRPKTHSLHPGDLQLIFNMLFEADGIQAGGGESWIPICLPGFNRNGYLYMYVSYLDEEHQSVVSTATAGSENPDASNDHEAEAEGSDKPKIQRPQIPLLLISTKKEAFFELQSCRDKIVLGLQSAKLLDAIQTSLHRGRPTVQEIVADQNITHFLYKSRGNLQFLMPSWRHDLANSNLTRRYMSIYEDLYASLHAKGSPLKVRYSKSKNASSLGWMTDVYEIYCIADSSVSKDSLAGLTTKIVRWIRQEEDRIFIIGGAVF